MSQDPLSSIDLEQLNTNAWKESDYLQRRAFDFVREQHARVLAFAQEYVRPALLQFCMKYCISFRNHRFEQILQPEERCFAVDFSRIWMLGANKYVQEQLQLWQAYQKAPAYQYYVDQLPALASDFIQIYSILNIPFSNGYRECTPLLYHLKDVIVTTPLDAKKVREDAE